MKKNEKGISLIQLLSFLVIVGVVLAVVVGLFSKYMKASQKKSYLSSAQLYIDEARKALTSAGELPIGVGEEAIVPVSKLKLNKDRSKSPYLCGWVDEKSYVVIKNVRTTEKPLYVYFVALQDRKGNCIELTEEEKVMKKDISVGNCKIQRIGEINSELIRYENGKYSVVQDSTE